MELIPRKFYFDRIFDDLLSKDNNKMYCDIYDDENSYYIEIDLPGINKEDITIEENNGYLTVKITQNNNNELTNKNYIRRERVYGTCERSFYLGELDVDNICAEFKNGILKIVIPKIENKETRKNIEIK